MIRITVDSIEDSRLEPFRDLKSHRLRQRSGTFIAEGANVVRRLLASGFQVESVLVTGPHEESCAEWLPADVPRIVVPPRLASQLVGYKFHSGVLACGRRRPNPSLEQIANAACDRAVVVGCAGVVDPENTGGVIRACAAFGAAGLLLGEGCADPYSRRVLRVSMGNAFRLPIRESRPIQGDLLALRDLFGFELVATVLDPAAERLSSAHRQGRMAMILGNEARGIPAHIRDICDRSVTIPMRGETDSLNVAVAAALFLYHFALE